jgi:hypothetical protein
MAQPREQIADRRRQARCHRALARRPPASPTAASDVERVGEGT